MGRPDRARVSESLRVSGILLRAYIAQLFLTAHPLLITEFPPGPLRKHVWILFLLTRGQIQTESKNDSIEALHPPSWKKNGGGRKCSAEKVGTRQWHDIQRASSSSGPAPISETLKHLLKKQHRAGSPEHIFLPAGEHSTRFIEHN